MLGKFANHYCPICFSPVDPVTGDHWHYCEYEAELGNGITNPQQPLTELEMTVAKLDIADKKILAAKAEQRKLRKTKTKILTDIANARGGLHGS